MSRVIWEGEHIVITEDALILKWYWFPTGSSKHLPWSTIRSITVEKKRPRIFIKTWGMAVDFKVWWHYGANRLTLHPLDAIIIDAGGYPKIGITPSDVDMVAAHIRRLAQLPGGDDNDEFEPLVAAQTELMNDGKKEK